MWRGLTKLLLYLKIYFMAETEVLEPVITKAGKPERVSFNTGNTENKVTTDTVVDEPIVIEGEATKGAAPGGNIEIKKEEGVEPVKSTFTEDQRKAFMKEVFGDENTDIEAIKEKLKPAPVEPTEEEKKKAQSQSELDIMKLFVDGGGTPEQFNEIKNIANGDKVELSKKKALAELVNAGFSEDEAKDMMKSEFYQIELDNIEQDFDNETEEEFEARKKSLQKKIDYGTKKLEAYSSYEQIQAANILKGLAEAKEYKDLDVKQEAAISSNVDELFSKLPRKQTIELGKYNDVQLTPVEHEVSEDSIKQVQDILKDANKRNNFFKNTDGTLNLPKLAEVLLNYTERDRIVKGALLEGQTRMTNEIRKTFPATTPYELGIGGATKKNNQKGEVASAGKPQRVSPQYN